MSSPSKTAAPQTFQGIGVSPGVVAGQAFMVRGETLRVEDREISMREIKREIARLEEALIETRRQILKLQRDLAAQAGAGHASVLDAHLMTLDDRSFMESVVKVIGERRCNAERALLDVSRSYAELLESAEDQYLRERVADIRDVSRRIARNLTGQHDSILDGLTRRHIIVAHDLTPSETAGLRKDMAMGFATDLGSATSHTAVMARALEIPAVVGLGDMSRHIRSGDAILIDGKRGILVLHPPPEMLTRYGAEESARKAVRRRLNRHRGQPAETRDGRRIVLSANMESPDELAAVKRYGADGVGLFRSEYLFLMKQGVVDEEEQTAVYRQVAAALRPAPVVIRTLDLGGDKVLPGSEFEREVNPFLGCRSIRLSLLYPESFKSQLRAILRASAEGNVRIMYPMVGNEREVVRANELLEEAKSELAARGVAFNRDIEAGMMVEVPAAALTADTLAEHVAFFSIGTNDLVQYTLAVDRVNERVAYLYEPTHPAVLELMRRAIDAARSHGRHVGICGEMAADPLLTMLLVGMGVDELSVAPSAVPVVKAVIRETTLADARTLAEEVRVCRTADEALACCRRALRTHSPEILELL
jgi:phosphoenolpyruvate-protein phosphotransferase (PTS system enzyme I)